MPVVLRQLDAEAACDALDGIRRGRVLKVDLDRELHDSNEAHPCVVISKDTIIAREKKYMVVPITSHSGGAAPRSYEVPLAAGEGELTKDCFAQPHLVQTIKRSRVLEIWGALSADAMGRIEDKLLFAMAIEFDDD